MKPMIQKRKIRPSHHLSNSEITRRLRIVARRSLPLYQRIANDPVFAGRLIALIIANRYKLARDLIRSITPRLRVDVQDDGYGSYNFTLFNNFLTPASRVGINLDIRRSYNVRRLQRICRVILIPVLRRMINDRTFARWFVNNYAGDENDNLRVIQSIVGRRNVRVFGFDFTTAFFGIYNVYIAGFILYTVHQPQSHAKKGK